MNDQDERFERRLVEETSKLRVDLAGVEVRLTERIAQSEGTLRQDVGGLEVRIEKRMGDLLKWSFAFWVGQVIAMTAIMNALLR
ncbi:MAG: hypothetical protein M3R55_09540 [Acidobacteriota bacterium]|nr:hypothetical protein [Acidobacteriota bacterium]